MQIDNCAISPLPDPKLSALYLTPVTHSFEIKVIIMQVLRYCIVAKMLSEDKSELDANPWHWRRKPHDFIQNKFFTRTKNIPNSFVLFWNLIKS